MLTLGVDPGTARCGYGLVAGDRTLACVTFGCIATAPGQPLGTRLALIRDALTSLFATQQIDTVAVERLGFARGLTSSAEVGHAIGVVHLVAADHGAAVEEYSPPQIKLAVTGYGAADKGQVQVMVQRLLGLPDLPRPDHAADALAVAICHIHSYRARARAGGDRPVIAELHGSVAQRRKDALVVRIDGTGLALEIGVPARSMVDPGSVVHLYTHLHMSTDGPLLVGFETTGELTLFTHLIGVSGVGPRTALRVISAHPANRLIAALDTEDVKAFEAVPGIGRKLASRIILELRGKLVPEEVAPGLTPASDSEAEALEALLTLGYSRGEAQLALNQSGADHLTVVQRIAAALRELGGRTGR